MIKIIYFYGLFIILLGCSAHSLMPVIERDCYDNADNALFKATIQPPLKMIYHDYIDSVGVGPQALDYISKNHTYYYDYPVFNPNNSNEIAFIRTLTRNANQSELCILNLCTGCISVIANNLYSYDISWGKNGWILFTRGDAQAWKIKANGDSLQRLTAHNSFFRIPTWNVDATLFYTSPSHGFNAWILDAQGHNKDTIYFNRIQVNYYFNPIPSKADFGRDKVLYLMIYGNGTDGDMIAAGFNTYSVSTKTHSRGALFPKSAFLDWEQFYDSPKWIDPDNSFLWNSSYKVCITNLTTMKTDTILKMGENFHFKDFDISPKQDKIICTLWKEKFVKYFPNLVIDHSRSLCIMNIDGTQMKDIIVPE